MAKEKINITIERELLDSLDEYCDKNYMNRSWAITQSVTQLINQQKMVDAICDVSYALKKSAESGTIDEKTEDEIRKFEAISKLFIK